MFIQFEPMFLNNLQDFSCNFGGLCHYFQDSVTSFWKLVTIFGIETMFQKCLAINGHRALESEKLAKAGTVDFKKHPLRKVGTRSRQSRPQVPGRFAFPGFRNPRIWRISRFGKFFQLFSPGLSRSFPREPPNRPRNSQFSDGMMLTLMRRQDEGGTAGEAKQALTSRPEVRGGGAADAASLQGVASLHARDHYQRTAKPLMKPNPA